MAEQETTVYHDIDVFGDENLDGTPKYYFDEEAINNALKLWLSSKKGDFLRRPELGGIVDRLLFKQMSPEQGAKMSFIIQNAINNQFAPTLKLEKLEVNPNYEQRYWEILIQYRNPFSNKTESIAIYTKDLSAKESLDYVTVEYTGTNLYNFCSTKLPSMTGILILYNDVRGTWVWGQYELTNFTISDSRYSDIIDLVNGSYS